MSDETFAFLGLLSAMVALFAVLLFVESAQ